MHYNVYNTTFEQYIISMVQFKKSDLETLSDRYNCSAGVLFEII